MNGTIECPYCEKQCAIDHDDGFGYDENVLHQMECPHCERVFVFETFVIYSFEAKQAECLNEGEHQYKITDTFPKEFSRMRCIMCGDERGLTDEERKKFNIGTVNDYINNTEK